MPIIMMSPLLYSKVKLTSTNKALRSGMDLLQPDDSFEHRVGVLLIVWLVPSLRGLVCHLGEPQFGGQRENRSIKWYLYLWNGQWIWKRSFTRSFIKESSLKTKWDFFLGEKGFSWIWLSNYRFQGTEWFPRKSLKRTSFLLPLTHSNPKGLS